MPIKVEINTPRSLSLAYKEEKTNKSLRFFYDRRLIYWYNANDPECAYQDKLTLKIIEELESYLHVIKKENTMLKQSVVLRGVACIDGYGKPQLLVRFNKDEDGVFVKIHINKFDSNAQKVSDDIKGLFDNTIRDAITAKKYAAITGDMLVNIKDKKVPTFVVFARDVNQIIMPSNTESRQPLPSAANMNTNDNDVPF
jgi:hypothetical protein